MTEQIANVCCDTHIDSFVDAKRRARLANVEVTQEVMKAQDAIDKHLAELRLEPQA